MSMAHRNFILSVLLNSYKKERAYKKLAPEEDILIFNPKSWSLT